MNRKDRARKLMRLCHFPGTGHFMIVPPNEGADQNFVTILHGETMKSFRWHKEPAETLQDVAAFFQELLPRGQVRAPSHNP